MTTRARIVFGCFVGLVTYGYIRLSQRMGDHSHIVYPLVNSHIRYPIVEGPKDAD